MKFKNKQEQLDHAIWLATEIHYGQYDKGGNPYILHPLHLMNQLLFDIELAIIAVLHDVIEDSNGRITLEMLRDYGYSERVLIALDLLTHNPEDDYLTVYIVAIAGNYDTIRVKRKDLEHNSDITRMKNKDELSYKDIERLVKYHKAFIILGKARAKFK